MLVAVARTREGKAGISGLSTYIAEHRDVYGGEIWFKLCALSLKEDIYKVDGDELRELSAGHLRRKPKFSSPHFQKFDTRGNITNLNMKELIKAMEKEKINIVEHNGAEGSAGHFAVYKRLTAPPDKIKDLVEKNEAQLRAANDTTSKLGASRKTRRN